MTRINLVPVTELANQHIFAEWREIKMVPKALARSLRTQSADKVAKKIPAKFTLNTGHVLFFYDKGAYLRKRYAELTAELVRRGFKFNADAPLDPEGTMDSAPWNNDYEPTDEALVVIRQRIAEKIAMKPEWYKFFDNPSETKMSI
ncbi:endonuclease V [Acanthocystis turfacea Chlorella virus MN0810.1]|nr:endonuclease V [Acanthocystis turfacea Chlorella virus MN0810.1]